MKSKVNINDDPNLEKEADLMGAKAEKVGNKEGSSIEQLQSKVNHSEKVNQLISLDNKINTSLDQEMDNQSTTVDNSESSTNDQSMNAIIS